LAKIGDVDSANTRKVNHRSPSIINYNFFESENNAIFSSTVQNSHNVPEAEDILVISTCSAT